MNIPSLNSLLFLCFSLRFGTVLGFRFGNLSSCQHYMLCNTEGVKKERLKTFFFLFRTHTFVLDWTCSLQSKHFLTLGAQREQVAMWPHGPKRVSLFMSEQTMHSSIGFLSSISSLPPLESSLNLFPRKQRESEHKRKNIRSLTWLFQKDLWDTKRLTYSLDLRILAWCDWFTDHNWKSIFL